MSAHKMGLVPATSGTSPESQQQVAVIKLRSKRPSFWFLLLEEMIRNYETAKFLFGYVRSPYKWLCMLFIESHNLEEYFLSIEFIKCKMCSSLFGEVRQSFESHLIFLSRLQSRVSFIGSITSRCPVYRAFTGSIFVCGPLHHHVLLSRKEPALLQG